MIQNTEVTEASPCSDQIPDAFIHLGGLVTALMGYQLSKKECKACVRGLIGPTDSVRILSCFRRAKCHVSHVLFRLEVTAIRAYILQ
jgi:hypothetical protein